MEMSVYFVKTRHKESNQIGVFLVFSIRYSIVQNQLRISPPVSRNNTVSLKVINRIECEKVC